MRHRVGHRKLGRVTEHRISLLRNQAQALLLHERIETTVPKARELRPFVERLITIAKRGVKSGDPIKAVNARRLVARDLSDRAVVTKLFDTLAPRFEARPGGYTRLLKLGIRRGDAAPIAQVELLGSEFNPHLAKGPDEGGGDDPKPAKGVRSRLAAAAKRLRGEGTDKAEKKQSAGGSAAKPAPRKRAVRQPAKQG